MTKLKSLLIHFALLMLATGEQEISKTESLGECDYDFFEKCLKKLGVKSDSIVRRCDSAIYQDLNYQWQANGENLSPLAYVVADTEQDIVSTVKCAQQYKIRLVPKGGGHSLGKFGFGNSHSVIVDVRNFQWVDIGKNKMIATVGAGMLTGPLAWKLFQLGQVFTPLAICPTIGIAGMATGGGEGFFVRKFGLALDNIVEVNIVTAQGQLLTVNENQNADLFWALRGGVASNFGIVTKFKFKVYPAPKTMFMGTLSFERTSFPEVFCEWQHVVQAAPDDLSMELDIMGEEVFVQFMDWTGESTNFEKILSEFPQNGNLTKQFLTYEDFLFRNGKEFSGEILSEGVKLETASDLAKLDRKSPGKIFQQRKSFYVNKKLGAAEIREFQKLVDGMPTNMLIYFEGYGGAVAEIPKNATAFVHRNGTLYNIIANYHDQDFQNSTIHDQIAQYLKKFFDTGKEIFDHKESYQNYVDLDLEEPLERYFGTNLPRLVEVKRKYDPDNFFFNPQSIPTKV